MELSWRTLGGEGPPIVILHGLFGSAQNWSGMGRKLTDAGTVYALDLRNHGDSPHSPTHTLADCVGDLSEWIEAHAKGPVCLVGHSLGGQVAMGFSLARAELVSGLVVIDIAPRQYVEGHEAELRAMRTDITACRTRAEVEALVAPILPDTATRQFILTNAVRAGDGFRWRLNVEALAAQTVSRGDMAGLAGAYTGPALLIACGRSAYVKPQDHERVRRLFPAVRIEVLADADHWPHVSAPAELERLLRGFLHAISMPPLRH